MTHRARSKTKLETRYNGKYWKGLGDVNIEDRLDDQERKATGENFRWAALH